ncbi:hypothetical protein K438DRAFT_130771 [Mycena galopus ATCC 62051]|nr:hypothetical protein K438DRAFT_130771 [Mycena galopus ATCC 62051]
MRRSLHEPRASGAGLFGRVIATWSLVRYHRGYLGKSIWDTTAVRPCGPVCTPPPGRGNLGSHFWRLGDPLWEGWMGDAAFVRASVTAGWGYNALTTQTSFSLSTSISSFSAVYSPPRCCRCSLIAPAIPPRLRNALPYRRRSAAHTDVPAATHRFRTCER